MVCVRFCPPDILVRPGKVREKVPRHFTNEEGSLINASDGLKEIYGEMKEKVAQVASINHFPFFPLTGWVGGFFLFFGGEREGGSVKVSA